MPLDSVGRVYRSRRERWLHARHGGRDVLGLIDPPGNAVSGIGDLECEERAVHPM